MDGENDRRERRSHTGRTGWTGRRRESLSGLSGTLREALREARFAAVSQRVGYSGSICILSRLVWGRVQPCAPARTGIQTIDFGVTTSAEEISTMPTTVQCEVLDEAAKAVMVWAPSTSTHGADPGDYGGGQRNHAVIIQASRAPCNTAAYLPQKTHGAAAKEYRTIPVSCSSITVNSLETVTDPIDLGSLRDDGRFARRGRENANTYGDVESPGRPLKWRTRWV